MLISIIIPCFNNQDSISPLMDRLLAATENPIFTGYRFQIVFVDDGSKDNTYLEQKKIKDIYPDIIKIVKLTRNFGSYNSFLAGMTYADGDVNVYLHADLQDPPELIPQMFKHYLKGYKFVIANRIDRDDKSIFSSFYHWMVKRFAVGNIPKGGFDLILFDKSVKSEIVKIGEKNTNNVYLMSWLGYPYISIPYKREKREHGISQWTLLSKGQLFIDTVFSFTKIPLWTMRIIFFGSIVATLVPIMLLGNIEELNLTIFVSSLKFILIYFSLMIVIEYLDRIHESVRNRPNFVVDNIE